MLSLRKASIISFLFQILGNYLFMYECTVNLTISDDDMFRERIVGGRDCEITEFPFLVSIHGSSSHSCGGNLINHMWVLTAAHCCKANYEAGSSHAYIGLTSQGNLNAAQKISIDTEVMHPQYSRHTLSDDVCMVKLSTPVTQSSTVAYVRVARPTGKGWLKNICKTGKIAGWGVQTRQDFRYSTEGSTTGGYDPHLKCAELTIPEFIYCVNHRSPTHGGKKFCAMHKLGHKDICKGDSGGPILCGNTLVGIVSGGRACGIKNVPGSFVRMEFYHEFIKHTIEVGDNAAPSICDNVFITLCISSSINLIFIILS